MKNALSYVRVKDGSDKVGDKIIFMSTNKNFVVT